MSLNININMVKTITITEDAYNNLKKMKLEKESFSDVINRINSPKKDITSIIGIMKGKMDIEEAKKKIKEFKEEFTKDTEKRKNVLARQFNNIRNN